MLCRNFSNSFYSILWSSEISNLGQNPNYSRFWQNLNFWTAMKLKKMKFQKFLHKVLVSPWYLPISTNLALSNRQIFQIRLIYPKNYHFSVKGNFPYISSTAFERVLLKQKVAIIERHMTPFWKEERWATTYIKCTKSNFLAGPLNPKSNLKGQTLHKFQR